MISTARAFKQAGIHAPVLGEVYVSQKRQFNSLDHYSKYGEGGRNSFNGTVATVFGATGFLGRYVVNRLTRAGTQVVIPFRGSEDDVRHIRVMGELGQIVFMDYDIRDYESILKTMTHSSVAINLVGRNYSTRNFSMEDCLVTGAQSIARAAKENNIRQFIHVSALNAKAASKSKFFQLKAKSERAVTEIIPSATIIRPAECYGQEDRYLNKFAYLRKLPFGVPLVGSGWNTTKRPVLISDVAQGVVNAVRDKTTLGKTFELYGPEEYFLHDMVAFVYRMIKKPFRAIPVPMQAYTVAGWLGEQSIFAPKLTRDLALRQFLSEEINEDAYTFEDLGISPENMNDAALAILRRHREYYYHDQVLDENEFCKPITAYQ